VGENIDNRHACPEAIQAHNRASPLEALIPNAPAGVETHIADVSSAEQAIEATAGAATIYHAINVSYRLQVELMPGIGEAVVTASERHGARLVVLDTLYPYGEADGDAITEQTPWAATSRKGRMRTELTDLMPHSDAKSSLQNCLVRRIRVSRGTVSFHVRVASSIRLCAQRTASYRERWRDLFWQRPRIGPQAYWFDAPASGLWRSEL
jgi:hypothetical protein